MHNSWWKNWMKIGFQLFSIIFKKQGKSYQNHHILSNIFPFSWLYMYFLLNCTLKCCVTMIFLLSFVLWANFQVNYKVEYILIMSFCGLFLLLYGLYCQSMKSVQQKKPAVDLLKIIYCMNKRHSTLLWCKNRLTHGSPVVPWKITTEGHAVPAVVNFQWNNGADCVNLFTPRRETILWIEISNNSLIRMCVSEK